MTAMEQTYDAVMAMPTSRRYRFALEYSEELKRQQKGQKSL